MSNKMKMNKKLPYTTPEGYFESLKDRLNEIPSGHRYLLVPYFALVAAFAAIFIVGNIILSHTAVKSTTDEQIIEYLIDSRLSLYEMEDYNY